MLILIAALVLLQRRNPHIAIGSWLVALGLILASQLSWYVTWYGTPYYAPAHTFRLCADLLTGVVLLLFTGRPLSKIPRSLLLLSWNAAACIVLEILYGLDVARPGPYCICAAAGAVISVVIAMRLRRHWMIPIAQIIIWVAIGDFSARRNYRASAYLVLAAVYGAAALHVWFRLRKGSLGRIGIVASLAMWSVSFFVHPWVLNMPRYRALGDEIWNMQKFVISMAMLIFLFEEEIRVNAQLAFHDQLTGLPNRRTMEQRLLATIESGRATVLLMDVDGFKAINDSLGHLAGDEVLCHIASKLKAMLRANETLSRLGGDEFLIVSTRDPTVLKESVASSFAEPVIIEGVRVDLRVSMGSSTFPGDANGATGKEAISHLLRAADRSMYAGKRNRQPRRTDE